MKTRMYLAVVTVLALGCPLVADANPDLFVYEGFQYETGGVDRATSDRLHGQPNDPGGTDVDATGLVGTWQNLTTDDTTSFFLEAGSMPFGDLATAGNKVRSDTNNNNDIMKRVLAAAASNSISSASEIWISFLAEKLQNNFNAAEGGVVLANQSVGNSKILENNGSDGLQGFAIAPTTSGSDWTAYAWNGSNQVAGASALSVGVGNGDVRLLVGHIAFDAGTGGADVFTFYEYQLSGTDTIDGGTLSEVTSLEADVDQSLMGVLNVTRQVNTAYDEIRIGRTLSAVTGGPPPPPAGTVIMIQ